MKPKLFEREKERASFFVRKFPGYARWSFW
jgi:hypothetical protein